MKILAARHADRTSGSAPSRRHAWILFGILFALMVVDYVDRQIVVSMFPHLKAQWSLSDAELARLLAQQGLKVARRTITKYRALMRLPSVDVRRADMRTIA